MTTTLARGLAASVAATAAVAAMLYADLPEGSNVGLLWLIAALIGAIAGATTGSVMPRHEARKFVLLIAASQFAGVVAVVAIRIDPLGNSLEEVLGGLSLGAYLLGGSVLVISVAVGLLAIEAGRMLRASQRSETSRG